MILNWDNHLVEWANRLNGMSFEWGRIDCLTAAITAVAFVAGEDVVEIDDWDDRESFVQAVADANGPLALLRRYCVPVGIRRLRTGDLIWTPSGCSVTDLGSVAVVIRNVQLVVTKEDGARLLPLAFADGATGWRYHAD